ncbi:MAG: lysine decarboxylase [Epsilonproteobacteria bacterium]|jgi:uncharacterized protein (TIGR00725 family)|nr:lysine decarboxylase [Campylobacterota bacterium]NPA88987.1 LOG family protein [Campylobacterota bacterium]
MSYKFATTFGASRVKSGTLYNEGVELGKFLAHKGYIVKCGGYGGMMEAVSRGVYEAGGRVIGIGILPFEGRPENPYLTEKIVVGDIFERLRLLTADSELFVVQRGSIGTLNELFMVWVLKYALNRHARICLIGEEYNALLECPFIPPERLGEIEIFDTLEDFKNSFTHQELI